MEAQPVAAQLVGVREAARQIGVNASTITRQVQLGIIPSVPSARGPLIDVAAARQARADNLDPSMRRARRESVSPPVVAGNGERRSPPPQPPGPGQAQGDLVQRAVAAPAVPTAAAPAPLSESSRVESTYQVSRAANEAYRAKRAQLEYERELGGVVDRRGAEASGEDIGRALQDALASRREVLAEQLAGLAEPRAVELALEDADRALLATVDRLIARTLAGIEGAEIEAAGLANEGADPSQETAEADAGPMAAGPVPAAA